jgi:hypothetical protein
MEWWNDGKLDRTIGPWTTAASLPWTLLSTNHWINMFVNPFSFSLVCPLNLSVVTCFINPSTIKDLHREGFSSTQPLWQVSIRGWHNGTKE